MGSFKLRLVSYFLLLSLVPLVAASWAFSEVATRGELANTDARLNAALRVAVRDYTEQVREAAGTAASLARVSAVQRAFIEHDPSQLVRIAREEPSTAFYSRERLLAGNEPQDLAAERSATVLAPNGRTLGRIVVWVPLDEDLLRQLLVNAGLEREDTLALANGGEIVAGRPAFIGSRELTGERAKYVELGAHDYRAVATPILSGPTTVTLIALTPKGEIESAVSDLRERFLLFATWGVGQLDDFHIEALGLYLAHGQGIVSAKHAQAVSIVGKREIHLGSILIQCGLRSGSALGRGWSTRSLTNIEP